MELTWTKPYYGIEHSSKDAAGRYCTVRDHKLCVELVMHDPAHKEATGQFFTPPTELYRTMEAAKHAANYWITHHKLP